MVLLNWSQQLRYGERTARGIVWENQVSWALMLGERRKERNSKRIVVSRDMVRDIASSRGSTPSAPDKKNNKRNGYSLGSAGQLRCLGEASQATKNAPGHSFELLTCSYFRKCPYAWGVGPRHCQTTFTRTQSNASGWKSRRRLTPYGPYLPYYLAVLALQSDQFSTINLK